LSGHVVHPAEVLHCFFFEALKDIFESVDNQTIIGVIKDAHFSINQSIYFRVGGFKSG